MGRWLVVGAVVCVGAADARADNYVSIHVAEVRVASQRPGNAGYWDGAAKEDDSICATLVGLGAGAVATYVSAGNVAAGAAASKLAPGILCGDDKQKQRDPRAPDLLVRLSADQAAPYYTPIARDAYYHDFKYGFFVPLAAVPDLGVKFTVFDQDGATLDDGELLGSFRLTKEKLDEVAGSSMPLVTMKDGAVQKFELLIRRVTVDSRQRSGYVDVGKPLADVRTPVMAGQVVTISATGRYNVSSLSSKPEVGPAGFKRGYNSGFNITGLSNLPHASAIAKIGRAYLPVGTCGKFIVPQTGSLQLGVNDKDVRNNEGRLRFLWRVEAPSADAWRQAGAQLPCSAAVSSQPVSCAIVARRLTALYLRNASGAALAKAQKNASRTRANWAAVCKRRGMSQALRRCYMNATAYAEARRCK